MTSRLLTLRRFLLTALPALGLAACGPAEAPAPSESDAAAQAAEAEAAASAKAKAEREAKLASFYGGGEPTAEDADRKKDAEHDSAGPPVNVEVGDPPPPPPRPMNQPAPPDPGGPPVQ